MLRCGTTGTDHADHDPKAPTGAPPPWTRAASWLFLLLGGGLSSCVEHGGCPPSDPDASGIEALQGDLVEMGEVQAPPAE